MGHIDAYIIDRNGSRRTICKVGDDPLRDDAPKGQIAREIDEFERSSGAKQDAPR